MKVLGLTRLRFPVLALLLAVAASGLARAEASDNPTGQLLKLSVEDVALLVLKNNRDLQVRQLTPVIVGTFELIERGVFDPELFAELEYDKERASETDQGTSTQFDVEGNDATVLAGIRKFLPTGTTIEGTIEERRSVSNRAPEQQVARLGLSVNQALLQGFGPAVNLAAVRQAKFGTVASHYELRGFTEALLAEAETAYWNFVLAWEQIAIFESSLAVARRQRDETELRIEVGILPEVEAAAARAEVALREQALIDARSLLEDRRLRLLRLVNPGPGDSFDQQIQATSEPRLKPVPVLDLSERLQLAEKMRPDLNEARIQLEQMRLETVVTRNGLLPRLDFFVALGKTGYADSFSGAFRDLSGNTYDFRTGLRLSQALGNRSAEARHVAARATLQQSQEAVANLRQLVRLDVHLAINQVERIRQRIAATAVTRALQEETLVAEKARFDVGASTTLLVSQAQRDLLAIQIAEVEAIVNYRIAMVNLFLSEGSLLERRGIRLGN